MSPRRTHAYRPLSLQRRAWLTLGAVVLGGAGVVTYAVADPGAHHDGKGGGRGASVHTLKLADQGGGHRGWPSGTPSGSAPPCSPGTTSTPG
ncbi:hypothetical protein O1M54_19820 [Streptomyces diastatochromogenes]|nr:hypothetical protein [Streptomyces diastatochromogenes]